jgi:hypothetical protein
MKLIIYTVLVIGLFLLSGASASETVSGEFQVKVTPSPKNNLPRTTTAYEDLITIKDGKLNSKVNAGYGYQAGPITVRKEGDKLVITGELEHPKHGKNRYELVLQGNQLAGDMKWGKIGEDGKPKAAEYTITPKK